MVVDPRKSGTRNGFVLSRCGLSDRTQKGVLGWYLGLPSVLVSVLLICKKEGDLYGECESWVILVHFTFSIIQRSKTKHVDHLGSTWLRCGSVLAQSHSKEKSQP